MESWEVDDHHSLSAMIINDDYCHTDEDVVIMNPILSTKLEIYVFTLTYPNHYTLTIMLHVVVCVLVFLQQVYMISEISNN